MKIKAQLFLTSAEKASHLNAADAHLEFANDFLSLLLSRLMSNDCKYYLGYSSFVVITSTTAYSLLLLRSFL